MKEFTIANNKKPIFSIKTNTPTANAANTRIAARIPQIGIVTVMKNRALIKAIKFQ